jgi:hypothetical protein
MEAGARRPTAASTPTTCVPNTSPAPRPAAARSTSGSPGRPSRTTTGSTARWAPWSRPPSVELRSLRQKPRGKEAKEAKTGKDAAGPAGLARRPLPLGQAPSGPSRPRPDRPRRRDRRRRRQHGRGVAATRTQPRCDWQAPKAVARCLAATLGAGRSSHSQGPKRKPKTVRSDDPAPEVLAQIRRATAMLAAGVTMNEVATELHPGQKRPLPAKSAASRLRLLRPNDPTRRPAPARRGSGAPLRGKECSW